MFLLQWLFWLISDERRHEQLCSLTCRSKAGERVQIWLHCCRYHGIWEDVSGLFNLELYDCIFSRWNYISMASSLLYNWPGQNDPTLLFLNYRTPHIASRESYFDGIIVDTMGFGKTLPGLVVLELYEYAYFLREIIYRWHHRWYNWSGQNDLTLLSLNCGTAHIASRELYFDGIIVDTVGLERPYRALLFLKHATVHGFLKVLYFVGIVVDIVNLGKILHGLVVLELYDCAYFLEGIAFWWHKCQHHESRKNLSGLVGFELRDCALFLRGSIKFDRHWFGFLLDCWLENGDC